MKKRFIIATLSGLLSACVSQYPNDFYTRPAPLPLGNPGGNMEVQKASSSTRSAADSVDNYKVEIASRIAQMNANFVYPGNPQSMLRSVVVVHYVLAADGRLVKAEIVRSNQDKYAETTALASLQIARHFQPLILVSCEVVVSMFLKPGCLTTMAAFNYVVLRCRKQANKA